MGATYLKSLGAGSRGAFSLSGSPRRNEATLGRETLSLLTAACLDDVAGADETLLQHGFLKKEPGARPSTIRLGIGEVPQKQALSWLVRHAIAD